MIKNKTYYIPFIFFIYLTIAPILFSKAQNIISLQDALKSAKIFNASLKTAQFNIQIAEGDLISAKLRPNPVLNNQSLQLVKSSKFYDDTNWNNKLNRQVWWQLTKPIQLPASKRYKINSAIIQKSLAELNFAEAQRNLFYTVAMKWQDAWSAKKKLQLLMVFSMNADTLLKINELRYKNQIITNTELLRTQVISGQYKLQFRAAKRKYENEIKNLQLLMGQKEPVNVDTSETFNLTIYNNLDSLIQKTLNSRSDIVAIRKSINLSKSDIRLQKALAYSNPELGMIYNPQNTIPYIGVYGTVQLPVFSRNQGEISKSLNVLQQSEQNLIATQAAIETELSLAFQTFKIQEQNLKDYKDILLSSQQVLTNVQYAYLRGGTNMIDFLEAQRSWLETQQQYYETLQSYRESYIELLFSSGLINEMAQ